MAKKIINIIIILIVLTILGVVIFWIWDSFFKKANLETDIEELSETIDVATNYLDEYFSKLAQEQENGTETKIPTSVKVKDYTNNITYEILGKIVIDKIKISYPILSEHNVTSLKQGITKQFGVNPNEIGNMILAGHNNRNGTMFGKIKQLKIGDIVKIVDLSGKTIQYKIYASYDTTPENTEHFVVADKTIRHIVLTTCSNDGKTRLILKAKQI